MMKKRLAKVNGENEYVRTLGTVLGALIYAFSMNKFIIPISLYSGGFMGISQIVRTLFVDYLNMPIGNFDIAGIIYYVLNVPVFILAYKSLGKTFFRKTVLSVTSISIFLSIIRIPNEPILGNDVLATCVIGGLLAGVGTGITLMTGGSSGGTDIIGLYLIKNNKNFSIGKINLIVNLFIYSVCLFLFDETIVIYSIIFAAVSAIAIDKVHSQNINVQAIVVTKNNIKDMEEEIMNKLTRGITKWDSKGAYTGNDSKVLFIVLSKYEVNKLKRIVKKHDENAFIVVNEGIYIDGNYTKKI